METLNSVIIPIKNTCRKKRLHSLQCENSEIHLNRILCLFLLILLTAGQYSKAVDPNSFTSGSFAASAIRYRLVEGSTLTDNWLGGGRPTIRVPIRGYFWLKSLSIDPLFSNYSVKNLKFHSTGTISQSYSGSLLGTYRAGGEVALLQQMVLKGTINDLQEMLFDSGLQTIDINFPWIELDVKQIYPDSLRVFDFHLVAVPAPKIWFSTSTNFTSSSGVNVSDGDILSAAGRIIRRNNQLTARLGIMPMVPDLGLDAIMLEKLSNSQKAIRTRAIYFSLPKDVFSETLGLLHNGDLLSEKGYVFKTNGDLVSKFKLLPTFAAIDIGLDAAYVWPWGEVWFSTKSSFPVEQFEMINPGDLISSYGKVVLRNSELLEAFKPMEKIADFGLDALEILWPYVEADLNEDGVVDSIDYSIFTQAWKPGSSENDNDLNCAVIEGNPVDMPDLAAFFEDWSLEAQ